MNKCKHDWLEHETKLVFQTKNGRHLISVRICNLCDKVQAKAGKIKYGKWG